MAVKAAQNADELNTLAKQTGISTAELQKMQYAADRIDVDTDTIVGGMKKLKKQLEATNSPLEKLGIKTKNAKGEFRDITDIFYDSVKALAQIPNETERDVVAMELFGKSADELAGIIDDGGAALRALGEEAENLGVIIPQEDLDKANELNDAIDQLKAQAMGTFAQIGVEIANTLMPYLPQIKEFLTQILDKIRAMSPETLEFIAKTAAALAVLSPMASMISGITSAIQGLSSAFGTLGGIVGISGGWIALIVVAIMEFVAAVTLAINKQSEFSSAWNQTWNKIRDGIENFSSYLREKVGAFAEPVIAFVETTVGIFKGFINAMRGLIETFAGIFTGDWTRMWNGLKLTALGFCDEILNIFMALSSGIIGAVNAIVEAINRITSIDLSKLKIPTMAGLSTKFAGGMATGGTIGSGSSAIVGEAGAEILTVANGSATVTPLTGAGGDTNVIGLLETYLPYLAAGNTIVMDSGALVGSIAPDMNAALGTIAIRGGHR